MGPLDPSRLGAFLMRQIPPSDGEVVERGNVLPLGTYRTPDGRETTTLAFPQPMREGLDALAYALGYRQDPNAPAGYVTHDALNKGGQGLAESAMVGSIAAPKPANALAMGIKAYHGSPHKFDKFSMDKIGAGEGAQAYGHGLYFAENPSVARSYKQAGVSGFQGARPTAYVQKAIEDAGGDVEAARTLLHDRMTAARGGRDYQVYQDAYNNFDDIKGAGHLYKVDIDADPNQFLDWDKPLSEQPEIAKALGIDPNANIRRAAEIRARVEEDMRLDGRTVPDEIDQRNIALAEELESLSATGDASSYAPRSAGQARELLAKGIKGIRYLDEGSRGAGEGSRNYVVFDDQLITIEDILAANPMAGAVPLAFPAPQEDRNQALARFLASGGA